MYSELDCPWYLFDNSYRSLLGACLILFGICGILLNGWLFVTFIHSHLLTFKSHILILHLCCASMGRNLLGGFPLYGTSSLAKRWLFGEPCCLLFGFFNQYLALLQMTSISVLCLERYVQSKYFKKGKELTLSAYCLFIAISWIWATILSVPPLAGFGGYTCDITRTACTLDWNLQDIKSIGYMIPYILGGSLIPIVMITVAIYRTLPIEKRFYRSKSKKEQKHLTKSTVYLTLFVLLFWLPQCIHTIWIAVPQLVRGFTSQPPLFLSFAAILLSELSTSVPVLCYLILDPRIRTALLGRMKSDYGVIKNKTELPFINERFDRSI